MSRFSKSPILFERKELIEDFKEFQVLYEKRPFESNEGGMRLGHSFALYCILRKINPSLIVESGVLKGQGTWLIENICPNAEIICIDIYPDKRKYTSKKAKYYTDDFRHLDWSNIPENSLAFFDDHQNAVDRLIYSKWSGFKHIIFEDNDPANVYSNFYTLKKAFSNSGYVNHYDQRIPFLNYFRRLRSSFKTETKKLFFSLSVKLAKKLFKNSYYNYDLNILKDIKPNNTDSKLIDKNIDIYYEFPPLLKDENSNSKHETESPIFSTLDDLLQNCNENISLNIKKDSREATNYNWFCYVKLK
jgi:hypothetical protein